MTKNQRAAAVGLALILHGSSAGAKVVGYWKFDETGVTSANDSTTFANNGIIKGAKRVAGHLGKGLKFNGTVNSYVEVPHSDYLSPANSVTVTVWVQPLYYRTSYNCLVYKQGAPTGTGWFADRSYGLWITTGYGVEWTSTPGSSGSQATCQTGGGLYALKKWTHLAGVVDALKNKMIIYVNGVKSTECDYNGGSTILRGEYPLRLGGFWQTASDQSGLGGVLDEVRIYDRALTDAQILADMNRQYGLIQGQITDAATGLPLKNTKVTATRTGYKTVKTNADANGYFELSNLDPGDWTVQATKSGYQAGVSSVTTVGGEIALRSFGLSK